MIKFRKVLGGIALIAAGTAPLLVRARKGELSPSFSAVRNRFAQDPSKFVKIAGANIHLRDEGDGPVMVMIHGAGTSLHLWNPWVALLRDRYRIVRFDMPPSPLTRDSQPLTPRRQFELLEGVIGELDLRDLILVGNSTGANAAVNYAASHPENVRALALSTVPLYSPRPDQYRNPVVTAMNRISGALFPTYKPRWYYRAYVDDLIVDKSRITEHFVAMYHASSAAQGVIESQAKYLASRRTPEGLKWVENERRNAGAVRCPTLIQWGDGNTVLLPDIGDKVAALFAKAPVELIHYPDVGHYPSWEIPEKSVEDMELFLAEHGVGAS
ncbi:alpha/beta hydrolase [Parasphingopyxis algicola]|uniref:alpha/beta fold hydrolase n=1 Tax=Parasphingopyxis algicola TaxID=2026624 RepID=UPI0015A0493D|nr:alpha/beta hydrolase [Parasphingopyxis algicola]QLC26372.1 alpha/beta hydrolase [Parasphingopyxis algicola]